jgi:signal transduction histidine kinase
MRDVAAIASIDAVRRILEVVCRTTGMGFAAVARVTDDQWVACAVRDEIEFGLEPGGELDVKTTICDEVRASGQLVVIENVAEDETYCKHGTPRMYGFQSYISVPILLPDGRFFGTLCAIDPRPATINTPEMISMFELFADLIGFHLSARDRVAAGERALIDERRRTEIRDQFIAVLGHDLRNPLAAIRAGAMLLAAMPLEGPSRRAVSVIESSAARMAGLIENVLDFARGRLGEGIPIAREPVADLEITLDQVVTELRTAWPGRAIDAEWRLRGPIVCDPPRIAQLLSNLLGNALTHGDQEAPVRVTGITEGGQFLLSVANDGDPIPPEKFDRLFQPFSRASDDPAQQGLGLGLYIAAEIARAHDGRLDVESSAEETRFTLRMPVSG